MIKLKSVLPLLISIVFISCSKEPGPGGLASIKGKVYAYDLTPGQDTVAKGYLGDVRVFIGAADENVQFDDTRTSYNGSFEFNFLRKGKYKVWVISKTDTAIYVPNPDQQEYQLQDAEVVDKKQEIVLPDFIINI